MEADRSFVAIVDHSNANFMIIPKPFVTEYGGSIDERVVLRTRTGIAWPMRYGVIYGEEYGLYDGWHRFVNDFPLDNEDLVVLCLKAANTIEIVAVYSPSGLHKPFPIGSNNGEGSSVDNDYGPQVLDYGEKIDVFGEPSFTHVVNRSTLTKYQVYVPKVIRSIMPAAFDFTQIQLAGGGPIWKVGYMRNGQPRFREGHFKHVLHFVDVKEGDKMTFHVHDVGEDRPLWLVMRVFRDGEHY